MANKIRLCLAVAYFAMVCGCDTATAQWTEMTKVATKEMDDIFFTDAKTGYIAGDGGTILKTTDGGATWTAQKNDDKSDLNAIYFTDANMGYAVGFSGAIIKTTDGGTTWKRLTEKKREGLYDICFTDKNTGYIAGWPALVLKTTDAGATWTKSNVDSPHSIRTIFFTDANTGYLGNDKGKIFKTTDAGAHWAEKTPPDSKEILWSIYFTNANTGYAIGNRSTILITTDAGETWTKREIPLRKELRNIFFTDENTGYIAGEDGSILKTVDKGMNWYAQITGETVYDFHAIHFTNANTGIAVGGFGIMRRTVNGGDGKSVAVIEEDRRIAQAKKAQYEAEAPERKRTADSIAKLSNEALARRNAILNYFKGVAEVSYGNYAGAISKFDLAIAARPTFTEALIARKNCYRNLQQPEKSAADSFATITMNNAPAPGDKALFSATLKSVESEVNDRYSRVHLDCYYKDGFGWFSLGKSKLDVYLQTTEKERENWRLKYNDILSEAIAYFNKAIAADDKVGEYYLRRGEAYTQLRNYDQAGIDFYNAERLDRKLAKKCYEASLLTCPKCKGERRFWTGEQKVHYTQSQGTKTTDTRGVAYTSGIITTEHHTGGWQPCERCKGKGKVQRP